MHVTGSSVLLDSTIVIHHFRRNDEVTKKLFSSGLLFLPSVVVGELYYGAYKSNQPDKNLELLTDFLLLSTVLPVDVATANYYGQIKAVLAKAGNLIPENDIWIAALAREYQLPIATRDKHFGLVSDVTVLYW
jgi:tRNA(fMet)-specific endonuclease VapC